MSGTAIDKAGHPISGVEIGIADTTTTLATTTTDARGRYSVIGDFTGRLHVTARREWYVSQFQICDISNGQSAHDAFTLSELQDSSYARNPFVKNIVHSNLVDHPACSIEPDTTGRYVVTQ